MTFYIKKDNQTTPFEIEVYEQNIQLLDFIQDNICDWIIIQVVSPSEYSEYEIYVMSNGYCFATSCIPKNSELKKEDKDKYNIENNPTYTKEERDFILNLLAKENRIK